MNELVQKLMKLEKSISSKKGRFLLFALFLSEEAQDKWDLLAAAPWISKDKGGSLKYLADKVQRALDSKEIVRLSRIVIIDEDNIALDAIHRAVNIEHGKAEIRDSVFFGLDIKHAYLITSQREASSAPANKANM